MLRLSDDLSITITLNACLGGRPCGCEHTTWAELVGRIPALAAAECTQGTNGAFPLSFTRPLPHLFWKYFVGFLHRVTNSSQIAWNCPGFSLERPTSQETPEPQAPEWLATPWFLRNTLENLPSGLRSASSKNS